MPLQNIAINKACRCIKAKRFNFKRHKEYMVQNLYQDVGGDMMVQAINEHGETIHAFANRFAIFI